MPRKEEFLRFLSTSEKAEIKKLYVRIRHFSKLKTESPPERIERLNKLINQCRKRIHFIKYEKLGTPYSLPSFATSIDDEIVLQKDSQEIFPLDVERIQKIKSCLCLSDNNTEEFLKQICFSLYLFEKDKKNIDKFSDDQKRIKHILRTSSKKMREINSALLNPPPLLIHKLNTKFVKVSGNKSIVLKDLLLDIEKTYWELASNAPDISKNTRLEMHVWELLFKLGDIYFKRLCCPWDTQKKKKRKHIIVSFSKCGIRYEETIKAKSLLNFFKIFCGLHREGVTGSKLNTFFSDYIYEKIE